jgi:GNAT superfamily N-acetyltransferase
MEQIRIEEMKKEERSEASEVLGKAFTTQPSSFAIYRDDPDIESHLKKVFGAMLKHLSGQVYVAKQGDTIVGVMRMVQWPNCQISFWRRLRMMPALMRSGGGFGASRRAMKFRGTWAKKDPKEPHWHLDPLGVTPKLQGKGVGSQMMEFYCKQIDLTGLAAYHETDRPENVTFYQKFGFEVIGEERILDFDNWYLWRPPQSEKP